MDSIRVDQEDYSKKNTHEGKAVSPAAAPKI